MSASAVECFLQEQTLPPLTKKVPDDGSISLDATIRVQVQGAICKTV